MKVAADKRSVLAGKADHKLAETAWLITLIAG